MKRVLSCIVLLCFILSSLGLVGLAEGEKVYRVEGTFTGAGAEAPVSIFVLKDGYSMEDLASSTGSVLDKVYYTNIFYTTTGGAYSFDISVPSEALNAQCVLSCNGEIKQDRLRTFLVSNDNLQIIYASSSGSSSNTGLTASSPYNVSTAISKASTSANAGKDVDIALVGGRYGYQASRIQVESRNNNKTNRITMRPVSKDEPVRITSKKALDHQYITKVTNEAILSRLPEVARGKVYELDFKGGGFADEQTQYYKSDDVWYVKDEKYTVLTMKYAGASADTRSIKPPIIYVNGKRQRLSQYPNEGALKVSADFATAINAAGNPTLSLSDSKFDDVDVSKWVDSLDSAYLTGFLFESFRAAAAKITAIDTTTKTLTLDGTRELLAPGYNGPRVTIVNLLEEMDVPGEYYFDTATKMIYYFAPEEITEDDVIELSNDCWSGKYEYPQILYLNKSDNFTFQDLEFDGSRFDNAIKIQNCSGIQFINCDIHAAGETGLTTSSATNTLIEGCNIYDTGKAGALLHGGVDSTGNYGINVQTSAAQTVNSNNIVRNCHIYNFSQNPSLGSDGQGVVINRGTTSKSKSLGDKIENNTIHGSKFIGAVRYGGLRLSVARNEMYNVLDAVEDAGVVYSGRTFNEFGNYVTENYIHDFTAVSPAYYANMAIYWDDHISGQTAERNIIVSPDSTRTALLGIRTIGYDNVMRGNILVDTNTGLRLGTRSNIAFGDGSDDHELYASLSGGLPATDYERYQDMVNFKSALNSTSTKKMQYKALAEKNVSVNNTTPVSLQYTSYTTPTYGYNPTTSKVDNVTASTSIFVNTADENYVIKAANATSGTAYAAAPNENDFDMDLIGTQIEVPFVDHEFKLLYPANESYLTEENLVLTWEQANFSDRYDYVIATDSSFSASSIVEEGSTKNNFVIPTTTLANGTYYWKVTAANESRDMGRTWSSEEAYQTFTIGDKMDIEIIATEVVNSSNVKIETLKGAKEFKVNYTVYNNTAASKDYVVFASVFTPEGDFVQAEVFTPEEAVASKATASGTLTFAQSATVAAAADGYYIRTFIFDSAKHIAPLSFFDQALKK